MRVTRLGAVVLAAVGVLAGTLGAAVGATIGAPSAGAAVVRHFGLEYSGRVYGDFMLAGNTVLVCPSGNTRCADVMERKSGSGNNNDFDMQYANAASGLGGYDSSTAKITIPAGADVAWAHLDWGGNTGVYLLGKSRLRRCDASAPANAVSPAGSPDSEKLLVKVGTEPVSDLAPAGYETTPATESGPHYYTATADVRAELAKAPTGYGCVGGWSLTVVYKYPRPNAAHAPSARAVYVYEGHVLQRSNDQPTTTGIDNFQVGAEDPIRAGVTAYEGDYNVAGSRFAVNGKLIANPDNPGAGTNKFFDSYADGTVAPDFPNNMSVDAKGFDIPSGVVPLGSTDASLTFSTKGDTYLVQSFAFSVPIPDVLITDAPVPPVTGAGQPIEYTTTVTDNVDVAEHNAEFTAHLAPVPEDAYYEGATASSGTLHYQAPDLTWKGSLRPGQRVVIHIKVRTVTHLRSDVRLREYVIGEGRIMGCQDGRGPRCAAVTKLEKPVIEPCTAPARPRELLRDGGVLVKLQRAASPAC